MAAVKNTEPTLNLNDVPYAYHYANNAEFYIGPDAERLKQQWEAAQELLLGLFLSFKSGAVDRADYEAESRDLIDIMEEEGVMHLDRGAGLQDRINHVIHPGNRSRIEYELRRTISEDDDLEQLALEFLANRGLEEGVVRKNESDERNHRMEMDKFIAGNEVVNQVDIPTIEGGVVENTDFKEQFSGGNFVYHGMRTAEALAILKSGAIKSYKTLLDEAAEVDMSKPGGTRIIANNSGFEGISWSMNDIDALPGSRGHIVGFITTPEVLMKDNAQLVVPSRPSPSEVLMMTSGAKMEPFYEAKRQLELYAAAGSFGESNSVSSSLIFRSMELDGVNLLEGRSKMLEFLEMDKSDQEQLLAQLSDLYSLNEEGVIEFDLKLYQQSNIPVLPVFIAALIEHNMLKGTSFGDARSVVEVLELMTVDNIIELHKIRVQHENFFKKLYDESGVDGLASPEVSVEDLWMVVPGHDKADWIQVLERCENKPKGIVTYDGDRVRFENFASPHVGDHEELTAELRQLIPEKDTTIDYYRDILGLDSGLTPDMRSGVKYQVLREDLTLNARHMTLAEDGSIEIA